MYMWRTPCNPSSAIFKVHVFHTLRNHLDAVFALLVVLTLRKRFPVQVAFDL